MKQILILLFITLGCSTLCATNPSETVLISDVSVPLIVEGKQVGSMTLKAGSPVTFVRTEGESIWITRGDSQPFQVPRSSIKPIEQKPIPQIGASQINQSNALTGSPVMSAGQAATSNYLPSNPASVQSVRTHPCPSSFPITINGEEVIVTKIGDGPIGVTFFPYSDSKLMLREMEKEAFSLRTSMKQCSFFLWSYPDGDFSHRIHEAMNQFLKNRDGNEPYSLPFQGLASSIVTQIEAQSGIKQTLLVGNSLGAGIILWDYAKMVEDPDRRILLISPSKPFLPPLTKGELPSLNKNTTLLASEERARGWHDESEASSDFYITKDMLPWIMKYRDEQICRLLLQKNEKLARGTFRSGRNFKIYPNEVFLTGHKTIGNEISINLLIKLMLISLGLSERDILLQSP